MKLERILDGEDPVIYCVMNDKQFYLAEVTGGTKKEVHAVLCEDRNHLREWMPATGTGNGEFVAVAREDMRFWENLFRTRRSAKEEEELGSE
jgi:hypothetical protein